MAQCDTLKLTRTREDLVCNVQYAGAALAADDDKFFFEFLTWLQQLLAPLGSELSDCVPRSSQGGSG